MLLLIVGSLTAPIPVMCFIFFEGDIHRLQQLEHRWGLLDLRWSQLFVGFATGAWADSAEAELVDQLLLESFRSIGSKVLVANARQVSFLPEVLQIVAAAL